MSASETRFLRHRRTPLSQLLLKYILHISAWKTTPHLISGVPYETLSVACHSDELGCFVVDVLIRQYPALGIHLAKKKTRETGKIERKMSGSQVQNSF